MSHCQRGRRHAKFEYNLSVLCPFEMLIVAFLRHDKTDINDNIEEYFLHIIIKIRVKNNWFKNIPFKTSRLLIIFTLKVVLSFKISKPVVCGISS